MTCLLPFLVVFILLLWGFKTDTARKLKKIGVGVWDYEHVIFNAWRQRGTSRTVYLVTNILSSQRTFAPSEWRSGLLLGWSLRWVWSVEKAALVFRLFRVVTASAEALSIVVDEWLTPGHANMCSEAVLSLRSGHNHKLSFFLSLCNKNKWNAQIGALCNSI